jgi:hypothetical protein
VLPRRRGGRAFDERRFLTRDQLAPEMPDDCRPLFELRERGRRAHRRRPTRMGAAAAPRGHAGRAADRAEV